MARDNRRFVIDVDDDTFLPNQGEGAPTISWDLEQSFLSEGQEQLIVVNISPVATVDTYSRVIVGGGSATQGSDFSTQIQELFIPAFSSQGTYLVRALDDAEPELAEDFRLILAPPFDAPSGADDPTDMRTQVGEVGTPGEHRVVIAASDNVPLTSEVSYDMAGAQVSEGVGNIAVGVNLTRSAIETIQVRAVFREAASTATLDDVVWRDELLTFLPGEVSKVVDITVLDDSILEPNEVFTIGLELVSGPVVFGAFPQYSLTIGNDDAEASVEWETDASVAISDGRARIIVMRLSGGANPSGLSVGIALGGDAEENDFVIDTPGGDPNVVEFLPNAVSAAIRITALDDGDLEETLTLTIQEGFGYQVDELDVHTVTLLEDMPEINTVQFATAGITVAENIPQDIVIPIRLGQPASEIIRVRVDADAAQGFGVAAEGQDYDFLTQEVMFTVGSLQRSIFVRINDDAFEEPQESARFVLSVLQGDVLIQGQTNYDLVINDDDTAEVPLISWDFANQSGVEGAAEVQVPLRVQSGPLDSAMTINVNVMSTATLGSDYTIIWPGGNPGQVTIEAGSDVGIIRVQPLTDAVTDPAETIRFQIQGSLNYDIGTNESVTLTIFEPLTGDTIVEWETDGALGPEEEILVSFVTGIDPLPPPAIVFPLPDPIIPFFVNDVPCDVFPASINRDGLVDSVQVVGPAPNTGQAIFTVGSDNPQAINGIQYTDVDLGGMRVVTRASNEEDFIAEYPPPGAAGFVRFERRGRYWLEEDTRFSRMLSPNPLERGPGVTWNVDRRPGCILLNLIIHNNLYTPDAATLHATDDVASSTFWFESMELAGIPAGFGVVEAEVADNSQDLNRTVGGQPRPWIVRPEPDGVLPGINGNHAQPAGCNFMRRWVLYDTSVWTREEAREFGRLAGYACAVAGDNAVSARPFYGPNVTFVPDQLSPRRQFAPQGQNVLIGRAASIAYERQLLLPQIAAVQNNTVSFSAGHEVPRSGYWFPFGSPRFASSGGNGITPIYDANWTRSGWRFAALRAEFNFQRAPIGVVSEFPLPSSPLVGQQVQAEDLVAANGGEFFPYDHNPFPAAPSQIEFWFLHWQRSTFPGNGGLDTRITNESRVFNNPRIVNGNEVRRLTEQRIFQFDRLSGQAVEPPETAHYTRLDGRLEALAFGANIGWARHQLRMSGAHIRRVYTRHKHNTPQGFNNGFNRNNYDMQFFRTDYVTGMMTDGVDRTGWGIFMWERSRGNSFRANALEARLLRNDEKVKEYIQLWGEEASRSLEAAVTSYGCGDSFFKFNSFFFDNDSALGNDDGNFPESIERWGVHDPVNRTGALPGNIPGNDVPDQDWRAHQSWMDFFLSLGVQMAASSISGTSGPQYDRMRRSTENIVTAMWREFPNGARNPGDPLPPAYDISSTGSSRSMDPPLLIPHAWRFTLVGGTQNFPEFLDERAMLSYTWAWRQAREAGDTALGDELRGYIAMFFGLPTTATSEQILDAAYGSVSGFTLNSTSGQTRERRFPYLMLIGELEHE